MLNINTYNTYNDYVNHQLEKTSDKSKQKKWKGPEWQYKIDIFKGLFQYNNNYIFNKKNGLYG